MADPNGLTPPSPEHLRRPRYRGTHPRRFDEKYKEHDPGRYEETVGKVLASGKTPAGMHRPVMVKEILEVLSPAPGELAVDCTLGYGGHAQEILPRLDPGGRLIGLDADPIELPKTEVRLRALGFGEDIFVACRSNFAGLPRLLADPKVGRTGSGADIILADLGVSSMQIDDPVRGFSVKREGPLDMRMNPERGQPASAWLSRISPAALSEILVENSDEPYASVLAPALAGRTFQSTRELSSAIRSALPRLAPDAAELSVRRVFQAIRIEVNDEFSALDTFLRNLKFCLNPNGRVAILTFHSGEDRRVKKAFAAGLAEGFYGGISHEVLRPGAEERNSNPRSSPAKLRWARRAAELAATK